MKSRPQTILLAGQWLWPWYEAACARGLRYQGWAVTRYDWHDRFYQADNPPRSPLFRSLLRRLQLRTLWGPEILALNRDLLACVLRVRPAVVWLYSALPVWPSTVREIRRRLPGAALVQYTNDNPFGPGADTMPWRHVRKAIPEYDLHFVYRLSNLLEFSAAGAPRVALLRSYFIKEDDFPVGAHGIEDRFKCDVVFAGHFEPDGRLQAMERLAAQGHDVRLYGSGKWEAAGLNFTSPLRGSLPLRPVRFDDYRQAICGAKIALCFLSKMNGDTYTRRCFQIPAMGSFLLCEYTDDMAGLFCEGVEAEFFRSQEELLDKVAFYLSNDAARAAIAAAGLRRVHADGHEVASRMGQFLEKIENLGEGNANAEDENDSIAS